MSGKSLAITSEPSVSQSLQANREIHFKDWPNTAGFNATEEQQTPKALVVSGNFPAYTAGSLYRTGPGFYRVPASDNPNRDFSLSHWFDGFTTLHKFDIQPQGDGSTHIMYTSRRQVDELVEQARKTGKLEGISFGQKRDPCDTFFQKFKTVFSGNSNSTQLAANVGVDIRATLPAEREMLLLDSTHPNSATSESAPLLSTTTDASVLKHFNADTLEPLGISRQTTLHSSLKGPLSGAHGQKDLTTGEIYNYNLELGVKATYRIFRSSPDSGKTDILAEISGPGIKAAYIHSMFLTENFAILCIWPAFFSAGGASILWQRNMLDAMSTFDPSAKTTWLVVDRYQGRGLVKKFISPAFFAFHTVNAWEDTGSTGKDDEIDIMCELVQYDNLEILHRFYYDNMVSTGSGTKAWSATDRQSLQAHLTQYKLPKVPSTTSSSNSVGAAELVKDILSPHAGDLPRINPNYATKPHRYVWSVLDRGKSSFIDGLGKTDTKTGNCLVWECPKHTPGEPVFLADPNGTAEDDGVILSVVLDGEAGTSFLLCLDARDMREVARAEVGNAVGLGFHGIHVPKPLLEC